MTIITATEFKARLHYYLERVFRDRDILKIKDGQRTFVVLGEFHSHAAGRPMPASAQDGRRLTCFAPLPPRHHNWSVKPASCNCGQAANKKRRALSAAA